MGEEGVKFITEKQELFTKIKNKGVIKSHLELLDAIQIMNSTILGLSDKDKIQLDDIIRKSMLMKIATTTKST